MDSQEREDHAEAMADDPVFHFITSYRLTFDFYTREDSSPREGFCCQISGKSRAGAVDETTRPFEERGRQPTTPMPAPSIQPKDRDRVACRALSRLLWRRYCDLTHTQLRGRGASLHKNVEVSSTSSSLHESDDIHEVSKLTARLPLIP